MISGVNLDTKSVTVEWYENGETKGKEVKKEYYIVLKPLTSLTCKLDTKKYLIN